MPDGRVVFAARRPPYPLDNGARIRSNHLLSAIGEAFDTTLVCFEHHPESPDGHTGREELERVLPGIRVVTVPGLGPNKRMGQLRSLAWRRSWTFGRYRLPDFGDALERAAADAGPCIVHYDDLGSAMWGPLPGAVNVYAPPDVEHRIARLYAGTGSLSRRAFASVEARKLLREEERTWRAMDLSLAVSEHDAEAMRAGGARDVDVVPNGTDPVDAAPLPDLPPGEPFRVLFVGSGAYSPYERGLAWLVRKVLPRLRDAGPVTFDAVGQPPARPVAGEGVTYRGQVPSVARWYEQAHAVVVPVFEGSGTRLKVIEAMAYERPVVSTRLGAEGVPVTPGDHYLRADEPDDFAAALLDVRRWLTEDRPRLESMLGAAREAITPLLWPGITARLVERYRAELARAAGVPAGAGG